MDADQAPGMFDGSACVLLTRVRPGYYTIASPDGRHHLADIERDDRRRYGNPWRWTSHYRFPGDDRESVIAAATLDEMRSLIAERYGEDIRSHYAIRLDPPDLNIP